jgi:outer membrane protein assembly factor BamB
MAPSEDAHDAAHDAAPEVPAQGGGPTVAFQVDVAHSGNQPASTLRPPLTRAWTVDFSASADFVSYPLIVDGRVFVTTSASQSANATLRALDLATGSVLWGPTTIGGIDEWSNAAYDAGRLYVLVNSGLLTAVDASTGAVLWMKQLPGQNDFTSPPTAAGGMVFTAGMGLNGTVYGVDGATGALVWTAPVIGGDSSAPALAGDVVFASYGCAEAYAFSHTDGTILWHHEADCLGGGGATPVYSQARLWARDRGMSNLVLDATTGAELGSFSASVIPAFADQRGFFLAGTTLQALDVSTRTILWSFDGDGLLASAPLVVNGFVYIGSNSATTSHLYALDPATGTMQWSDTLPAGLAGSGEFGLAPVVAMGAGGNALVVPAGPYLVCYR